MMETTKQKRMSERETAGSKQKEIVPLHFCTLFLDAKAMTKYEVCVIGGGIAGVRQCIQPFDILVTCFAKPLSKSFCIFKATIAESLSRMPGFHVTVIEKV